MVAEYMDVLDRDLAHVQITVTTLDDRLCATYEKASPPSRRVRAIKELQEAGYDVQLRLSPYIPEIADAKKFNALGIDKICVEFLRVNNWIRKWFDIDYSPYTLKHGGYEHLPLETKKRYIEQLRFKEITVCEDEDEAYDYWREYVNHNKDDCCNLRQAQRR
jgi:DNA repair photolyase